MRVKEAVVGVGKRKRRHANDGLSVQNRGIQVKRYMYIHVQMTIVSFTPLSK